MVQRQGACTGEQAGTAGVEAAGSCLLAIACRRAPAPKKRTTWPSTDPHRPPMPTQVTPFDCPVCRVAVQMFVSRLQVRGMASGFFPCAFCLMGAGRHGSWMVGRRACACCAFRC